MNANDFISLIHIFKRVDRAEVPSHCFYYVDYGHIKGFLMYYYAKIRLTDIKLAKAYNKTV